MCDPSKPTFMQRRSRHIAMLQLATIKEATRELMGVAKALDDKELDNINQERLTQTIDRLFKVFPIALKDLKEESHEH